MHLLSSIILAVAPLALRAQPPQPPQTPDPLAPVYGPTPVSAGTATATSTVATRAALPPLIDGQDIDPIWATAQLIDTFRQFQPKEDGDPAFRTTAKVAYDDRYLYVFVRMYDPHPDSIIALLSRHDVHTQSDWIKVMVDSYHDKRTGYEMAVNPRGVKRDYYTYNDMEEDQSWDGVWDVETRIDSLGWTAEFRIPFDQMRFAAKPSVTMGLGIWRDIARLNERDSWPLYRNSKTGISSQLGEITGINGLKSPRHAEVVPYVVAKNNSFQESSGSYTRQQQIEIGGDIKYGVTSNLTLDGTINPDFGQVESDPAVLNLTNFQTYLAERRPFFVEGMGIFRFDVICGNGPCTGLFYSRRIGRQPQLTDGAPGTPTATTILGAAKLTGRTGGGLSVGVLDALTAKETNASDGSTAEPATNYLSTQFIQEYRDGRTNVGAMVTAVNRQLDPTTSPYLASEAYSGGFDIVNQSASRDFQIKAYVVGSHVAGSPHAMALIQSSSIHYYQRPGSGLTYDTTRTALDGDAEKLVIAKYGGGITRFDITLQRTSPGFEINDVGFLDQAGIQSWNNWFGLQFNQPGSFYRRMFLNLNEGNYWTTQGVSGTYLNNTYANINGSAELKNSWWIFSGMSINRFFGVYDAWFARGGPATYRHPFTEGWIGFDGDPRMMAIPHLFFDAWDGAGGKSHGYVVNPFVDMHPSSNLGVSVGINYQNSTDYVSWVDNIANGPDTTYYSFAALRRNTISTTIRVDAVFTPRLTLQLYMQPYIDEGRYDNLRQLATPRATDFNVQMTPFTPDTAWSSSSLGSTCDPWGASCYNFNYQQLNLNTVLRWEYRPGSALYVVWTHGRSFWEQSQQLQGVNPQGDVNNLFTAHPLNTFLIKGTYWISL